MKLIKRFIPALITLSFVFLCSFHVFADTYYYGDGYLYTMPDQNHAIIFGVDGDDYSEISFPEVVHYRYVSSVGVYAFSGDEKVTSVSCENATHMEKISAYAFENCTNLASVKLTPSIQTIGVGAFSECSSLTSVTIPDSVTSIGYSAFSFCSRLTSVTIPNSVTSIDHHAFFYCPNNLTVTCEKGSFAWKYCQKNKIKCVSPDGSSPKRGLFHFK